MLVSYSWNPCDFVQMHRVVSAQTWQVLSIDVVNMHVVAFNDKCDMSRFITKQRPLSDILYCVLGIADVFNQHLFCI